MEIRWQSVPLVKVLKQDTIYVTELEPKIYPKLSVKLYGRGVILDAPTDGANVKMQRHQFAKSGQIILSEIWAKKGAIGIVPPEGEGALVTSHFFLFDTDETTLCPGYITWLLKGNYFAEALDTQARGTTGYAAIRPKQFLSLEIPLPPLDEQRRIVARIEALATRVNEAQRLRKEAEKELGALIDSIIRNLITEKKSQWVFGVIPKFAKVNPSRKGQINLNPDDLVSFVPMSAVDDVTGTIARPQPRPYQDVSKGYKWFIDGDVIFARITPCMENGKSALAKNLVNGVGFGSTEFHVIRPVNKILGEWIHILTRSKEFRDDAASNFKGTAGQQRVPQNFLDKKVIPVPPIDEQRWLVAYLDGLQAQVDGLRRLQAETQKELDALIPSILDKAFKGEL